MRELRGSGKKEEGAERELRKDGLMRELRGSCEGPDRKGEGWIYEGAEREEAGWSNDEAERRELRG